jgi:AcrR family transcriptional regulator
MIRKTRSREKLINSAKQLFFNKGFNSTSVDEIVENVGMSKATAYRHFESKEDLLKEVIIDFFGNIRNEIDNIRLEDIVFEIKLEKFMRALVSSLRQVKPYLIKDLQSSEPALYKFLMEERSKTIDIYLKRLLQDGIDKGSIKSDYNLNLVSNMILLSIEKFSSPEFIEENCMTYEEVFKQVIVIILKGICK